MDANVIPAELHIGSIGHWSPWYKLFFTTFLHFWTIFIILTTNLLIVDFFCRLIGGAGSPMMLKSGSFSSTWTLATTFFTHTYCTSPRFPSRLAPCPPLPSTLPQNETHSIETIPPTRSKSAYHTRPRHASHVPLRQGARHWAPPPSTSFLCPPSLSMPPSSIHHICPPASITFPTKASNPKKRKGKKRGEEYSRYHAEQCWPENQLLSPALPLLASSLLQTHPLLQGNNSPEAWGVEPRSGAI